MWWPSRYHLLTVGCAYSSGSPNWRLGGGSSKAGPASWTGSTSTTATFSSGVSGTVAAAGAFRADLVPRRDLVLDDRGGWTATDGFTAPTRPSNAARAASCSASCFVGP